MKRLLLMLIGVSIMFTSFAQVKTDTSKLTVKQVYEDAKTGFKDAFTGLKDAAAKLEGPAKHVYGLYVYQHMARGIAQLTVAIILLIVFPIMWYKCWKNADFPNFEGSAFPATVGIVGTFVGFVILMCFFAGDGFTKIINPEYYAIQDIITAFKN